MIFRKNKPASMPGNDNPSMRGREGETSAGGSSPLARRFVPGEEPETIDLVGPSGFPVADEETEPDTRVTSEEAATASESSLQDIIGRDPASGKFYLYPGTPECPVQLAGESVVAKTELRRGDRIRIGEAEFEFLL